MSSKALFLDRDGVINTNYGYVHKISDFEFVEGIFPLCKAAIQKGYKIVIVSNQSGIARGYYRPEHFLTLTRWMEHCFWLRGINISQVNYCPHHPKQASPWGRTCMCRKPRPGMLFKAQQSFQLNLTDSILVGDNLSDMDCAQRAGIRKRVLLGKAHQTWQPALCHPGRTPFYTADKLRAITELL